MATTLLFLDLGFQEMFLILVVALLLYGGRLPEVARSLGRTVGELRRQALSLSREFRVDLDVRPPDLSPRLREIHERLGSLPREAGRERSDAPREEQEEPAPEGASAEPKPEADASPSRGPEDQPGSKS